MAALAGWTMAAVSAQQWPSFRGVGSSGVAAAAATPPVSWDLAAAKNVAWSTPIPGLAHSSPVVWGDRVFLTTSINTTPQAHDLTSRAVELQGSTDMGQHQWKVYSLDRRTGRVLWERMVHEGVPRVKRHGKATHASASPATNGRFVVVSMGSEGLYCFDMEGTLQWKNDLGVMDVGMVEDPTAQWGPGSSPIIDGDLVIMQDDRQRAKGSHLIAFDLRTGKEVWRAKRDEMPAWATPVIHKSAARQTIITNASRYIRGYDERDGREVWQLADLQAGRIYFTSEDGMVYVVRAGRTFELLASNDMREVCMATPAIANDMMIVRTRTPCMA